MFAQLQVMWGHFLDQKRRKHPARAVLNTIVSVDENNMGIGDLTLNAIQAQSTAMSAL